MFEDRLRFREYYNVQKILPAVYDDSLSYYELLAKLQCKLEEVVDFYNKLADYQDVQDQALADAVTSIQQLIESVKGELKLIIDKLTKGSLDWDVQHGYYTDTQDAMRDMFNDVTVHSYNIGQLNEIFDDVDMTVSGLANCGLNVKGLAVMNHLLLKPNALTDDLVPTNPQGVGRYTVEDLNNSYLDTDGYIFVGE